MDYFMDIQPISLTSKNPDISNDLVYTTNTNANTKTINKNNSKTELELLTPYSSSYDALNSDIITANTLFLYYDSDFEENEYLHISEYDNDADIDTDDDNDTDDDDDDDDDNDDNEYSVPLIQRITPPPPLLTNLIDDSDEEYENEFDYDDIIAPSTFNINLESIIPSLQLKPSPNRVLTPKKTIFEMYNTVTPIQSDNYMSDYYDNNGITAEKADNYNYKDPNTNSNQLQSKPKSFDFKNIRKNLYLNDYLSAHIISLIHSDLSE